MDVCGRGFFFFFAIWNKMKFLIWYHCSFPFISSACLILFIVNIVLATWCAENLMNYNVKWCFLPSKRQSAMYNSFFTSKYIFAMIPTNRAVHHKKNLQKLIHLHTKITRRYHTSVCFIIIFTVRSFEEDFWYSVGIHESFLRSTFMTHFRRSVKFWQWRKN